MKKIKRLLAVIAIATVSISAVGCKMVERTPESIGKTVLAKVGNEKITRADVDKELKVYLDNFKAQYGDDYETKAELQEQLKEMRKQAVDNLVTIKTMTQKAEELKLVPAKEELDKKIEEKKKEYETSFGSKENLDAKIKEIGLDEAGFNKMMKDEVILQIAQDYMLKDIKVTDEDINKYYEENKATEYTKGAGANAKHLLFEDEQSAKDAKAKIDSGSATFDDLFKEYEANKAQNKKPIAEDLDFVAYDQANFDKDFLAGMKDLAENAISAPVKSSFGYHIIKVSGITKESKVTPLDEVKETIKAQLTQKKQGEKVETTLEEWKKDLGVKIYEDRL